MEGGRDINNRVTYIGQVLVKHHGIIPVTIYPGTTAVTASIKGIHRLDKHVKVGAYIFSFSIRDIPILTLLVFFLSRKRNERFDF